VRRLPFDLPQSRIAAHLLLVVGVPSSSPPLARRPALLWIALAAGAAVLLTAVSYYFWTGNAQAPRPQARAEPALAHAVSAEQLGTLSQQLEARLRQSPDDGPGWAMLARSYVMLGRFEPAARAYAQAAQRMPSNADLLADYADALAMARGRKLEGEPLAIVKRALELDPGHVKSLALAGSAEFEGQRYSAAVAYWERVVPLTDAHSEFGRSIRRSIAQARELGKLPAGGAAGAPVLPHPPLAGAGQPAGAAGIAGTVKLAPALASRVAPDDSLFVFARAPDGDRIPLAVVRAKAGDLPYAFRLDDSQGLAAHARLSDRKSVVLVARISRSGDATAKPGDLQGSSKPVAPGTTGLEIVIDEVRQ